MSAPLVFTDEFREALSLLSLGSNLFLTGKAGTGKSTLIRHFMATTDRRVVVAAPTGIAALNVGGYTLHRLFGFSTTASLRDVESGTYQPGRFASTSKGEETLIIDEVSMMRADMFDMVVSALEKFGPKPGDLFGGVQLVLVGDLFQLPPVVTEAEKEFFTARYESPYFFSADRFSRGHFPAVALTTVFRQIGDTRLTSILNSIREGVLLSDARSELNMRTRPDFEPPDDEFWLTLAPTNRLVNARNRQRLDALPGTEWTAIAEEYGDLDRFDPPTERNLSFKVGAQIMMLNNDPADRWVNGTVGRVLDVSMERDVVTDVYVEFRDGSRARVEPYPWEITRPTLEAGHLRHDIIGSFRQFPFKLAWAITIHKSQGQTLDRLVVDLTGGAFDFGQVYVALSRCTSLDGLVLIRDVLAKDLKTDRRILRFLRSVAVDSEERRYCGIGILTVGEEGRMSRPRPVEIAIAFDDGTALSTLVNPGRDLADARDAYGLSVEDVLLAPNLAEAWALLGHAAAGCSPVGVNIDHIMGLIDFELKRLGHVTNLPLGGDVELRSLSPTERVQYSAGSALARAKAALAAFTRAGTAEAMGTISEPEFDDLDVAYILTRNPQVDAPQPPHMPGLSALLEQSRWVGGAVLGTEPIRREVSDAVENSSWQAAARLALARQLQRSATRVPITPVLRGRLEDLERAWGVEIVAGSPDLWGGSVIDDVLTAGKRICFTGTVLDPDGRPVSKDELAELARLCGLVPVENVTKTRCDALVVAEVGTQSNKAKKAFEWGKPIFSADEFFAWAASF